jgi:hypothetical protein
MDLDLLAGTRRACGFCAADLGLGSEHTRGPFWLSHGGKAFLDADGIIEENKANSVGTYVTRTRDGRLTVDYNTDSAAESGPEDDDMEEDDRAIVDSNDVEMSDDIDWSGHESGQANASRTSLSRQQTTGMPGLPVARTGGRTHRLTNRRDESGPSNPDLPGHSRQSDSELHPEVSDFESDMETSDSEFEPEGASRGRAHATKRGMR